MIADDPAAGAFGRRRQAGPSADVAPRGPSRPAGRSVRLATVFAVLAALLGAGVWTVLDINALSARSSSETRQVIAIVNQPVTHLPRTAEAGLFSPGWFHPGALKPDFSRVDVRASQEFPYADYTYVTSDLNPSEMFIADELEFNAMTKYFYEDRSTPKKKLTGEEMDEIDGLYRLLGRDDRAMRMRWLILGGLILVGGVIGRASIPLFGRDA